MTYERGKSPAKGLRGAVVAAAGPLGNYLFVLFLGSLGSRTHAPVLLSQLIKANAAMMLLNLLPALPLDGGRILFSAGYYIFGVSGLTAALSALGAVLGAGFVCLGFYGAWQMGTVNLSVLIVGAYLMVYALSSRKTMLAENLITVVQERLDRGREVSPMTFYRVLPDTRLYELIEPIDRARCAAFVFEHEGTLSITEERDVLLGLLHNPGLQISETRTMLHGL